MADPPPASSSAEPVAKDVTDDPPLSASRALPPLGGNPRFRAQRESLPIFQYREDLVSAIRQFDTLIVVGDTGSGKTTQVPQYIYESIPSVEGRIAITQPRRIAAASAAQRVSDELGSGLGDLVGYRIRFEAKASKRTRIVYMVGRACAFRPPEFVRLTFTAHQQTDGVLLREACTDTYFSGYSMVIVDEAHERSLETDVLLGLLKRTRESRPNLKLIIMSATLDVEKFSDFFGGCPVFVVPGRTFDVDVFFQKAGKWAGLRSNYLQRAVDTVLHIHKTRPAGHVLVFLTGQDEIERACRMLEDADRELDYSAVEHRDVRGLVCHPIYSTLDSDAQRAVFAPPPHGVRKIVVSTNIAQTSVTIPGIRYVVDTGFVKQKMYDPASHLDALLVVPVSQAAATQRAGRAGRTENGEVYRLYSREAFEELEPETVPEMQRSSLLGVVLDLKKMGIEDVLGFGFIDPPDPEMELDAMRQLYLLGALDADGRLTKEGGMMAEFPVSPHLARAIIAAAREFRCADELLTIAAMLSVEEIYISPRGEKKKEKAAAKRRGFAHGTGDHMTLLRIYRTWEGNDFSKDWCFDNFIHYRAMRTARNVRSQIRDLLERLGLPIEDCRLRGKKRSRDEVEDSDPRPVLRSICAAYYPNLARQQRDRPYFVQYSSAAGKGGADSSGMLALYLGQNSALFSDSSSGPGLDWVVYTDVVYTSKAQMRNVSRIDYSWVEGLVGKLGKIDDERLSGRKKPADEAKADAGLVPLKRRNSLLDVLEERGGASTPGLEGPSREVKADEFVVVHERLTERTHSEVVAPEDADKVGTLATGHAPVRSRAVELLRNEAIAATSASETDGEGSASDAGTEDSKRKEREDSVAAARERYLARKKAKR
ncbi:P-loop containing nucleoside triphosphate hydrolase protein [Hyaloraphidium curvatum]|nr:P-loop containing nucleoside triphosphate hydrolase protein [Hyaloraphidium curvatum]